MKKTTYKQSAKCKNFYSAIKNAISKNFNTNSVLVVGNSANYPDSVAIPTDMFMYDVIGFVQYDNNGKTVVTYACRAADCMTAMKNMINNNVNVVTRGITDFDQTVRLKFDYLRDFQFCLA